MFLSRKITFFYPDFNILTVKMRTAGIIPRYLDSQKKKYSEIKTFLYRDKQQFYDVYYPVSLRIRGNRIKLKSINDLLTSYEYVTIFGVAGSGKSTLINHLFLSTLSTHSGIPIVIELRKLNNFSGTLFEYICTDIFYNEFNHTDESLHEFLLLGKIVFMFDGFDELFFDCKVNIADQIEVFIDAYSENKFIITSRPGTNIESLKRFENSEVMPLKKHEIVEFVEKQKHGNSEFTERVIETIRHPENNNYIHYLTNPLLLSMFILNFENYPELPKRKSRFYENVFNTLYQRHDGTSKNGFQREKITNLKQDDFEYLLKRFCFLSYFEGRFMFEESYLKNKFKQIKDKQSKLSFDSKDLITDLRVALSIIVKDGLEYKFHHRSMQEYFTALFIQGLSIEYKKQVYLNKLSNSTRKSFDNQFNLWQLCFELDKTFFSESFIIPKIEEFLSKINIRDNFEFTNAFLEIIPINIKVLLGTEGVRKMLSIRIPNNEFATILEYLKLDFIPLIFRFIEREIFENRNHYALNYIRNNITPRTNITPSKKNKNYLEYRIVFSEELKNAEFETVIEGMGFYTELRSYIQKVKTVIRNLKLELKEERNNDMSLVDLI